MLIPTRCAALLFALAGAAQASSQLFQPRISRYDHLEDISSNHTLTRRALDELSNPSPIDARSIEKRYLIPSLGRLRPWPNNEVRYCFETEADKAALFGNLKDAIDRWWYAGLDQRFYKWTEVSAEECKAKRSTTLLIKRTNDLGHATTYGFAPADPANYNFGPEMELNDGDWGGYDTKVGTFAHEIGHVWGLDHEHQNPNYWRQEDGFAYANKGEVFGKDNFFCQNIIGYSDALESAQKDRGPQGAKEICTNIAIAILYDFSAKLFLPWASTIVSSHGGHKIFNVDWGSIMVCNEFRVTRP